MRTITDIVLHCSYTRPSMDWTVEDIRRVHVEENGWADVGYHWIIRRDGTLDRGRDEMAAGAHVAGHNGSTIGVCLIGGMRESEPKPDCNFTRQQWRTLDALVSDLQSRYPTARVVGHRDLADRDCPTFDAPSWANR